MKLYACINHILKVLVDVINKYMIQTTKKHWVNGYQKRDQFKSFNIAFLSYGIGFYWGYVITKKVPLYYELYKLN